MIDVQEVQPIKSTLPLSKTIVLVIESSKKKNSKLERGYMKLNLDIRETRNSGLRF